MTREHLEPEPESERRTVVSVPLMLTTEQVVALAEPGAIHLDRLSADAFALRIGPLSLLFDVRADGVDLKYLGDVARRLHVAADVVRYELRLPPFDDEDD